MSVIRQFNFLGQERIDVPFLRSIDSSVAGDFDMLAGRSLMANDPVVVRGFTINTSGVVGTPASSLQLNTADGIVANLLATESGSMLWVPSTQPVDSLNPITNPNVVGSFTPSSSNNIGIDFTRNAAASTSDLAEFLDPNSLKEVGKVVPLARILSYKIVITTLPFASQPNLIPIAIVVTTAQNNVSSITDARNMFGRLATGGDFPNTLNAWPFLTPRVEGPASSFSGPDKNFLGLRDWMSAVMTRVWESGGGEAWFSGTADRNVMLVGYGTPFGGGDWLVWSGTDITWTGLRIIFDNSTGDYNILQDQLVASPGLTDLADGECIYFDLQRQTNGATVVGHKAVLSTLGQGSPPGSRQVLAARLGSSVFARGNRAPIGTLIPVATTTSDGIVRLFQTPGVPAHPVVLNLNANNAIAWTATGGSAIGLQVTGAPNAAIAGGPTFGITPVPGPAGDGGVFVGGGGVQGGDGVQAFGISTSNPKTGGVFGGSWPSFSGATPGAGVVARGGTAFAAQSGAAAVDGHAGDGVGGAFAGGPGGNFFGGNGISGAAGGAGLQGTGGTSAVTSQTQAIGIIGTGGANGGDGIKGFGVCGIAAQRVGVVGTGGNAAQSNDPGGGGLLGFGGSATGGNADGGYGVTGIGGGGFGSGQPGIGVVGVGGATGLGGQFSSGVASTPTTPQSAVALTNGNLKMVGVANPNSNVGFVNTLTPKNIQKGWGRVTILNASGATLQEGFNVNSPILGFFGDNTECTVFFDSPMANANYAVTFGPTLGPTVLGQTFVWIPVLNPDGTKTNTSRFTFKVCALITNSSTNPQAVFVDFSVNNGFTEDIRFDVSAVQ